jgi:CDP-2,3-bis-(O-geranylgeranyl)-sn-glycerol synthase
MDDLILLLLLLIANGSPIVVRELLGSRFERPLDGGKVLADGHRLLGPSKTWRGLVAAVLVTTLSALALGWSWQIGATIGFFAMLGDTASSFIKRRLGMASSTMAPGLDHIPESMLPLLVCKPLMALSWTQVLLLSLGFMAANLLLSRLLHRLGIRRHPY